VVFVLAAEILADLAHVRDVLPDVRVHLLGFDQEEDGVWEILGQRGADLVQGVAEVGGLGLRAVAETTGVEHPQIAALAARGVPGRPVGRGEHRAYGRYWSVADGVD